MSMSSTEFIKSSQPFAMAHELPYIDVPIYRATPENTRWYGNFVENFDTAKVTRMTWPKPGWRDFVKGTGNQQSVMEGDFVMHWQDDVLFGDNEAFGELASGFVTGRLDKNSTPNRRCHVLIRDANYHPDGGQVFFPKSRTPFVLALAPACGDDVTPQDFKAFAFDGSHGFHIAPNVWHNSPYMATNELTFKNKQSSVFGCIEVDTVKEFGIYLRVPLILDVPK